MKIAIDFFGPPTAGKSTLVDELSDVFESEGINVASPTYSLSNEYSRPKRITLKFLYSTYFLILDPITACKYAQLVYRTNQQTRFDAIRNMLMLLSVGGIINKRGEEIQLYDQGYCEAVTSLLLSSNTDAVDINVFEQINEDFDYYLFVNLCVEDEVFEKRLAQRKEDKSRVGVQYTVTEYRVAEKTANSLFSSYARSHDNIGFITLSNNSLEDLEVNKQQLREIIKFV